MLIRVIDYQTVVRLGDGSRGSKRNFALALITPVQPLPTFIRDPHPPPHGCSAGAHGTSPAGRRASVFIRDGDKAAAGLREIIWGG